MSRTFALTIPQLPPALRTVVGNVSPSRIADTIEDSDSLTIAESAYYDRFVAVVEGRGSGRNWATAPDF